MFGIGIFVILFQLAFVTGVVVFAFKLISRLKDIAESQKSIAESQAKLVHLIANEQQSSEP